MDQALIAVIRSHVEAAIARLPRDGGFYSEELADFRNMFDITSETDIAAELGPALEKAGLIVEVERQEGDESIVFSRKD